MLEAGSDRLALKARGPIEIDVDYRVTRGHERAHVHARIDVKPRGGLAGRLLSRATDALLAGGMFDRALEKIALEATAPAA